jgi:prepilin-type N-terminal cleavage/methylation domain-containing protein
MRSRSAFTLVELLVVISVVSLLVALLLPALALARQSAQTIQCQTNLRALGQAQLMYVNDNKGQFPYGGGPAAVASAAAPATAGTNNVSWDDLLALFGYDGRSLDMQYATQANLRFVAGVALLNPPDRQTMASLYRCPSYTSPVNLALPDRFARAYAMVDGGSADQRPSNDASPDNWTFVRGITYSSWSRRIDTVPKPSSTFLMVEGDYAASTNDGSRMGDPTRATISTPHMQEGWWIAAASYRRVLPFHQQYTWNYLFVDGHVTQMSPHTTFGTGNYGGPSIDGKQTGARSDRGAGGMWTANPAD